MITGKDNYKKYGLSDNPDAALEMATAIRILFDGMINGKFTGKRLADFSAAVRPTQKVREPLSTTATRPALLRGITATSSTASWLPVK